MLSSQMNTIASRGAQRTPQALVVRRLNDVTPSSRVHRSLLGAVELRVVPRPSYDVVRAREIHQTTVCQAAAYGGFPDDDLKKSAVGLRTSSFLAFWAQLALSLVSAGVLIFSLMFGTQSAPAAAQPQFIKWFTFVGVVFAFLSTFIADGVHRMARKLSAGETINRATLVAGLITNNTMNLIGMGTTVVGLQAAVGTLVAKSLQVNAQNPYMMNPGASPLISLDVFTLQASTNTLLAHFISLVFTNIMLRMVNKPKQ